MEKTFTVFKNLKFPRHMAHGWRRLGDPVAFAILDQWIENHPDDHFFVKILIGRKKTMYATLDTYAPDCSACSRENYQLPDPSANYALVPKKVFIDSPGSRRQRRGGMGIDKYRPGNVQKKSCCDIREAFQSA